MREQTPIAAGRGLAGAAAVLILASLALGCREATPTTAPARQPGPVLTPASLNVVVGTPIAAESVASGWQVVQYPALGLSLKIPPSWKAVALANGAGVGVYPPGSDPSLPTPGIAFDWANTPYVQNRPVRSTGGSISVRSISGIAGQQYQDSKFALPLQSSYIELPYRGGTLLIITTIGPAVDLTPQLAEILKTVALTP